MSINKEFFNNNPVMTAVELFAAGWCNLDCRYCYITKDENLKDIHKQIINDIKSGALLKWLKEIYDDNLTHIAHWGTEPTLTLSLFADFYKEAINIFPNLRNVMFSTNMMTDPDIIISFIKNLPSKLHVEIQVSLDGPPEITDKNRRRGSADIIVEHLLYIVREIPKLNKDVSFHFKPTIMVEDIIYLSKYGNILYYYKFFDDILDNAVKYVKISKIVDPTIQVPAKYTKESGIKFLELYKHQLALKNYNNFKHVNPDSTFYYRLRDKLPVINEYYSKHRMFTCSSGDSNFAISPGVLYACHRGFYEHGLINNVTYRTDDNTDLIKVLHKLRSVHDFVGLSFNNFYSVLNSYIDVGLAAEIYRDRQMAVVAHLLCNSIACYLESLDMYGSLYMCGLELIPLLCNGFGEELIKRFINGGEI